MGWNALVNQAAETITAAFSQPALAGGLPCRVIVSSAMQTTGVFEQIAEMRPILTFLRSEVAALEAGDFVSFIGGPNYTIEAPAEAQSDANHVAYWAILE